jgi:hypothetical protein
MYSSSTHALLERNPQPQTYLPSLLVLTSKNHCSTDSVAVSIFFSTQTNPLLIALIVLAVKLRSMSNRTQRLGTRVFRWPDRWRCNKQSNGYSEFTGPEYCDNFFHSKYMHDIDIQRRLCAGFGVPTRTKSRHQNLIFPHNPALLDTLNK